jgi:aspartate carbamoyltransferase catalytic subunit
MPHLHHLTTLEGVDRPTVMRLLDRAEALREASDGGTRKLDILVGRTVLNAFFEPSTRTRTSFELAARRLGAELVNFDVAHSSTNKGESLVDTLHTLEAMHVDILIVRHRQSGTPETLVRQAMSGVAIVNAGDGTHAHPTQGLLDALTIRQHRPDLARLSVTICGDIRHSRVARADIRVLSALGVRQVRLCAPTSLLPDPDEFAHCPRSDDFDRAIAGSDVVIMLRVQKERMAAAELPEPGDYFARYGLTTKRLARAADDCMVLHPGPLNRGIEIAPEVADGPQSHILEQVANGVFVRMAVLADVLGC